MPNAMLKGSVKYCIENKLLFLCVLFSGCTCNHSFEGTEVRKASCAQYGIMRYTCTKCDAQYEEFIPKSSNHNYSKKDVLPATCESQGYRIYKCSTCGDSYSEKIPTNSSHNYVIASSKEATCTESGTRTYQCSYCSARKTETISATGHSFTEATCTTPKTCKNCGKTEGSALGHITGGQTCPRCGAVLRDYASEVNRITSYYSNGVNEMSNAVDYYKKAMSSGSYGSTYLQRSREALSRAANAFQNAYGACGSYSEYASLKSVLWDMVQTANNTVQNSSNTESINSYSVINSGLQRLVNLSDNAIAILKALPR